MYLEWLNAYLKVYGKIKSIAITNQNEKRNIHKKIAFDQFLEKVVLMVDYRTLFFYFNLLF